MSPAKPYLLIFAGLVFLFSGLIYLLSLSPSLSFIDSGELATVCVTLGIAHPTGYPLYTLLGRSFSLLPLGTPIFRLNLLSLFIICFANLILFLFLSNLFKLLFPNVRKAFLTYISFVSVLFFSFTPTLWSQASSNEVYALNFLFCSLLLYLFVLQLSLREQRELFKSERFLYLFSFLYGLSFGNHFSTLLLLPGFLFMFWAIHRNWLLQERRIFITILFFVLGLSIYLYLPIRSSCSPLLNWGDPSSFSNLKRHISGWQYRVWMFSESSQLLWDNLKNYLNLFYLQFSFYSLPFIFLGFIALLKKSFKMFFFLFLIFIFTLFYGINYEIQDIDPYFLPSFLVTSLWLSCGLVFLLDLLHRKKETPFFLSLILLILYALLPCLNLLGNYPKQDRSKNFFAYDYAQNILRSAKKEPVILTKLWDHYSPWLYLRFVEDKRPDVIFLDTELLRRSWYLKYLRKAYPELYFKSEQEIDQFSKQVYLFENNLPYDQNVIERSYVNMIQSFLWKNYPGKPLYCDLFTDKKFLSTFIQFPEGLLFRLQKELKFYPYDFPEFELRGVLDEKIYKDDRTLLHLKNYPQMIEGHIRYLFYFKQDSLAWDLKEKYQKLLSQFNE